MRGIVEIRLEGKGFVPAEYLLVRLEGTRRGYESITNSRGEYAFESVTAGPYTLVILVGKDRPVHRQRVTVPDDAATVTLPPVQLSADSLRS